MFMDLETLQWDEEILDDFGVPPSMLPAIRSSSEVYGTVAHLAAAARGPDRRHPGRPAGGHVRPGRFDPGEAKNTYGTGCFLLFNTGRRSCTPRTAC